MSVIQNYRKETIRHFFLIIVGLTVTPFIVFIGKNSLQIAFFSTTFFWAAFFYCLLFICITIGILFFLKKSIIYILFFSYFNFLQFYFFDIQKFFLIFVDQYSGYYTLFLVISFSLIAALISRSLIFRNFILMLLTLNIALSIINLIPVIGKSLQVDLKTTNIVDNSQIVSSSTLVKYPNIFYIVPDGLASPKTLKDYVGIDFKHSIKKFEEKGYSVSKHNYSSYNTTHLSLAALFQMEYPVNESSLRYSGRDDFYPILRDKNPKLLQYLKKNNYRFVIIPPLWGGCPNSIEYMCLVPDSNSVASFLNFFKQDYAISIMFENSFLHKLFIIYNLRNYGYSSDMNDAGKTAMNKMQIEPKIWSHGGTFNMIHMMIPHAPFRKENCSIYNQYVEPKEGYRSSVYCAFNRIHELTDIIIKKYPNATIVVQADHGINSGELSKQNEKFDEIPNSIIDSRLGIFTAVRGCGSNRAAELNQANIVEYIVECLVNGKQTKQFTDKSFYGFYEKHPQFGKVFHVKEEN